MPHFFTGLSAYALPFAPIYQHNDAEFRNHPRRAIADQYSELADQVIDWVKTRLDKGEGNQLAREVTDTFLHKLVAIDEYHNFTSSIELMNTFLGLNTVRVDLGPVDLLRATIIEKAASSGWTPSEIEATENEFTDTFTDGGKPIGELLPFVSIILGALNSVSDATKVFPSWGSGLTKNEVDDFLSFVSEISDVKSNTYFNEIRHCGSIPYSALLIYYYKSSLSVRTTPTSAPSTASSRISTGSDNPALHMFLVANYRALFDGRIGRTRVFAERLLNGTIPNLEEAAKQISNFVTGSDVTTVPDSNWLRALLSSADKQRSKRILNAMRLPIKSLGWGTQPFAPLTFGNKAIESHIDHLIPESLKAANHPGSREINTLRNFAPLTSNLNRVAKATSCSVKLGSTGIYENLLALYPDYHEYCDWLVNNQAVGLPSLAVLDNQALLEPNQVPGIGDDRIDFITQHLLERI